MLKVYAWFAFGLALLVTLFGIGCAVFCFVKGGIWEGVCCLVMSGAICAAAFVARSIAQDAV